MKKIFTCISLAAATFMATTPVMAQQQKLTDKEKAAVIEAIVPAMFEQVKQVSGIDIIELAKPNIENVLSSPVLGQPAHYEQRRLSQILLQFNQIV